jgi:hypothetical protein
MKQDPSSCSGPRRTPAAAPAEGSVESPLTPDEHCGPAGIRTSSPGSPTRRSAPGSARPPSAPPGHGPSGRRQRNALDNSAPSGWAEITHPFHPRRGQRLRVLKARQIAGVETLILRGPSGETLVVNQDWTDHAKPSIHSSLNIGDRILNAQSLLALVILVENIWPQNRGIDT